MSNLIEDQLEAWGLQEYIEKFKAEQIDEKAFLHMPDSMVKELIPVVGKRFYFLQNRQELLESENLISERSSIKLSRTESEDTCSIASSSSINLEFKNHEKTLKELLCESSCGKKILKQTRLTSSDRNKLCHLIIDKLLCKSKKITSEQFQELAAAIASVFKYENTSTYYVPSNTKFRRLANGKLWDKYNNLKKYIKQDKVKAIKDDSIEDTSDCQEELLKLSIIQPDDQNLENLWKQTFKARKRGISINAYYEEYPILKTSFGAILLQIDFELETSISTHMFPSKWSRIAPYILDLAVKKNVCSSLYELRNDVPLETLSLLVLPYLFPPNNVKTGNKKKWKPSKTEIADSFICRIPSIAELEPKLEKRKEKLEAFGLTLQPMIVAIGSIINLTNFYVVVNNIKYESTSLINAVNLCFQMFFALDAKYPIDSEMVWYFLQYHIYDIKNAKYARNFVAVDTTWCDLQELIELSE
ncbi:uncharacterized protein LOC114932252 [Nylanderia fulva]|uniref:uncharacterized protein LOC114932252 n=1 Tax=Nylanderia fulva TaxID=613905 RepID=UPI0010FAE00E|nr:uncharacterized protein LOC114932252 [Nylanderia fulva]